jgi:hypothetical protein
LSQLNLGYITRVNNVEGRKDFRGEGFELSPSLTRKLGFLGKNGKKTASQKCFPFIIR